MDNFDEARTATENMFTATEEAPPVTDGEQVAIETPAVEEPAPETAPTPEPTPETAIANEATQLEEQASQVAQQTASENEALRAQVEQLQRTISEMSQAREEEIVEEAMPTLDFDELAFADDETKRIKQEEYTNAMAEFVRKGIMKEMTPYIEQAKSAQMEKDKQEAIAQLAHVPELKGIETLLPQLDRIIANNKWLNSSDMPIDEKLINAFAIAKGVNAINTPGEEKKELTSEELMKLYDENPTFQELVEKKRIEAVKNSQQVPPFSASSGAVNSALNIKEKPKTFEEASERTRQMFGMK